MCLARQFWVNAYDLEENLFYVVPVMLFDERIVQFNSLKVYSYSTFKGKYCYSASLQKSRYNRFIVIICNEQIQMCQWQRKTP